MSRFVEKLLEAAEGNQSLLCIGLDPDPALLPETNVAAFNRAIIDATQDLVCAYKPNLAFYEALGLEGWSALRQTIDAVPRHIPVIGDAKRGDVGNTALAYARAMFEVWGFDATTVNAYGGLDTIEPFLAYRDRGVFLWCRSSNSGAGDLQGLRVGDGGEGQAVYERVATLASQWDVQGNLGLVVGATHPDELRRVRELCPDVPILIPGVGAQGGDVATAVRNGVDLRGQRAIISSSRQVLYASRGRDFAQAARRVAQKLRGEIQEALASRAP